MFNDWTEKDLQEYYNSAIGVDIKAPPTKPKASANEEQTEEVIELVEAPKKTVVEEPENDEEPEIKLNPSVADEDDLESLIVTDIASTKEEPVQDTSLDEFDTEDDDFFEG